MNTDLGCNFYIKLTISSYSHVFLRQHDLYTLSHKLKKDEITKNVHSSTKIKIISFFYRQLPWLRREIRMSLFPLPHWGATVWYYISKKIQKPTNQPTYKLTVAASLCVSMSFWQKLLVIFNVLAVSLELLKTHTNQILCRPTCQRLKL